MPSNLIIIKCIWSDVLAFVKPKTKCNLLSSADLMPGFKSSRTNISH